MEDLRLLNVAAFAIPAEKATKVTQYVTGTKRPPKVIKQTPAPGTPVIAGMTIEIQIVSFSDVPLHVVEETVATAIKNVPVAEVEKIFETDIRFKNAVKTGTIPDADRAFVTETLNRELTKAGYPSQLTPDEANVVVKGFNEFGFEF